MQSREAMSYRSLSLVRGDKNPTKKTSPKGACQVKYDRDTNEKGVIPADYCSPVIILTYRDLELGG